MSTLAANEQRRQLRYNFTDTERIEKAKALAESLNRYAATEAEKKRIAKDYDSRLDVIQAEIDLLNGSVLSGYELREYLCFWTYDEPRPGRKTLRKREGGEVVAEEDMTERDRQMIIEIIDSQASAGEGAGEKLALPATKDWPETLDELMDAAGEIGPEEQWMYDLVRDLFADIDETVLHREAVEQQIAAMVSDTPESELRRLAEFIRDRALHANAGWACLLGHLTTQIDIIKARAAEKKAKRRRASASGTVEVAADEGSRDDAGSEGKNDL